MFFGNDEKTIKEAVKAILDNKLVAIPTETVYGLAANALSEKAVNLIYKAKGRPNDNPLIIHLSEISDVEKYAEFPETAKLLAKKFWPGPLTMILKKKRCIPEIVTAGLDTVAVRIPDSKITRDIIRMTGVPLAAPSANLSGKPSPTKASHVYDDYNGKFFDNGEEIIAGIIDGGECEKGIESTIILISDKSPVLLRPGVITVEKLREFLPDIKIAKAVLSEMEKGEKPISPGMAHRHYSPSSPTYGIRGNTKNIAAYINAQSVAEKIAVMCFDDDIKLFSDDVIKISYGNRSSPESLAKNIFSVLRELDKKNVDKIFVEILEGRGVYLAVYNRLIRACGFSVIDADIPPVSICLTGPSGAGKTSVCEELKKSGFFHIDADKIAAELLPKLKNKLCEEFGHEIITSDGTIDRKKLARIAFSSKEKTEILNKITHPAITKKILNIASEKIKYKIPVLIDGAAIFEAGLNKLTDYTISVIADSGLRKKRILLRDNISDEMIDRRFSSQYDESFYIKNSDFYVINDGNEKLESLKNKIIAFIKKRKGIKYD